MDKERLHSIEERCIWRGKCNEDTWAYGLITDIIYYENIAWIDNQISVNADTLGQYIGRKDKTGKEVYEGDVIAVNGKYPKIIGFDNKKMAFCMANVSDLRDKHCRNAWMTPGDGWWEEFQNEIEIIGNRWDNPELLKTK